MLKNIQNNRHSKICTQRVFHTIHYVLPRVEQNYMYRTQREKHRPCIPVRATVGSSKVVQYSSANGLHVYISTAWVTTHMHTISHTITCHGGVEEPANRRERREERCWRYSKCILLCRASCGKFTPNQVA